MNTLAGIWSTLAPQKRTAGGGGGATPATALAAAAGAGPARMGTPAKAAGVDSGLSEAEVEELRALAAELGVDGADNAQQGCIAHTERTAMGAVWQCLL